MLLKRIYENETLKSIEVITKSDAQKFTPKFINKMMNLGFLTMSKGKIILHTTPELKYNVIAVPGIYCCHDETEHGSDKDAQKYVKDNFDGVESPDKFNPSGYRKDNFFNCELEK